MAAQKIRQGNDIDIRWSLIDSEEQPYIIEGKDIRIELNIGPRKVRITEFEVSGNTVHFVYYGKEQRYLGAYILKYIENEGKPNMVTFDIKDAFTLVEHSWQAVDSGETPETVQLEFVTIDSNIMERVGPAAGFGEVTAEVDDNTGTPAVDVETSGPDTTKNIHFAFRNLKGANGADGKDGKDGKDGADGKDGKDGKDGSDADVTAENIAAALGYTPANTADVPTAQEKAAWDAKYNKPVTGIPATDMAEAVQTSLGKADSAVQPARVQAIEDKIPAQASPQNQLADKEFVNSSVATATATFRGTYNLVSDLSLTVSATQEQIAAAIATKLAALSIIADNEDYVFVQIPTADATPTEISRVDRYKYNGTVWAYEWSLNNSSFTAAQWAAINSNITAAAVTKLGNLPDKPVDTASQTLSAAEQLQARQNIGATSPEVFWATYGTTTAVEIDAAVAAGKVVMCVYNQRTYYLAETNNTFIHLESNWGAYSWFLRIGRSSNNWTSGNNSLQDIGARVSTIVGNESDTSKYPSTKAVADYVDGIVGNIETLLAAI